MLDISGEGHVLMHPETMAKDICLVERDKLSDVECRLWRDNLG